ncbi:MULTISPECIES: UbiX family flavin prenyltransferase [Streptomyces]|uniref:UbiX family flavin prenyltransferase n=1 Tax=Streptomyces mirabilis TaxID=68239 RepID=A0ABU3UEH9_9ACTN|nr:MULTISPECIES: UbiX family flavin prenyltransferase [Streptomyces]MCX4427488.1 UbiX family flavin prenyltransferase [Streptomyces mirabilis]MCX4614023.1 UbiX family flavin prenyltransferase [Streptomyces mirabilis]MCX5354149.1 UbiX family flavin prenyltransferase [Streptomyces mirabilis]MDU8992273.1 UbiX family flavin prenyltransferase [Streptomyces mirabilis]NMI62838.1 UbiX family flavin prenyltransferase [Streptomyces sp. RLA2-12]
MTQQNVTVAVTGAGGTGVAKALLTALQRDDRVGHVDLLVSANGRKLVAFEFRTGEDPDSVVQALEATSPKVRFLDPADMSGPVTSGSYPSDAMIILPCAAGVLGRIAHGQTESLIERAADVMLKQRRRLVLCLREAPLNLIHLRNMVAVTEAGATVYPMIPTYYNVPETLAQLRDEFVERVLQFLGLPGTDRYQWDGSDTAARREHTQAR